MLTTHNALVSLATLFLQLLTNVLFKAQLFVELTLSLSTTGASALLALEFLTINVLYAR